MNAQVVRPSSQVDASQDKIAHGGERRESKPDQSARERRESKPGQSARERRESNADQSARDRRDSRWDDHRRARREQLVEATLAAVAKHGAGVGMDEIAAEAGTSKTVVYRHFADRAELYVAVCNRVAAHLLPTLRSAIETSGSHPREMVTAAIDTYLAFIEADPELYRFVVHQQTLDRPTSDPIDGLSDVVGQQAAAAITVALQQSGQDAAAAAPWGHGVVGLVRSAADWWLRAERPMLRTELAAHLTDLAWAGLSGVVTQEPNSSPTTSISTISMEAQ
jgi:AcrR family transcriptional regulator